MPTDPWAEFEEVTPAAPRGGPQPVLSVPNSRRDREDQRDDERLNLDRTRTDLSLRNEQDDDIKDAIGNVVSLQSRYEALEPVRSYRAAVPQLMQGLKAAPDATGDGTLIYSYVKVMDPNSVAQEGEQERPRQAAGVAEAFAANLKKQFNIEGGGALPEAVRQKLKRDMLVKVQEMGKLYRAKRQQFTEMANRYGVNSQDVVGSDDFDPYVEEFNRLRGNVENGGAAPPGVRNPDMRGDLPTGTDIEWSADQPDSPFDRDRYLQQNYGINGAQEARMVAFWNQNRGNTGLTPETAKQWFQASGIPAPSDAAIADTIEKLRKGYQIGNIDTSGAEQAYRGSLRADLQAEGFDPNSAGAYAARAARGLELGLSDEIEGIGGAVGALFSNEGVADGYRLARDRSREAFTQMEENQGALGTAAELAGGLVGGIGGATRAPLTAARAAREGAAVGGVAGFGYGEGTGDSLAGAGIGAATGGALGYGVGRGVEALAARRAARGTQPLSAGGEVIQAADNLNDRFGTNISPMPADAGGPTVRRLTGGAAQLPLSAGSIVRASENVTAEAKAARDAIAALTGTAATTEAAGEAALTGAQKYIKTSKTKVDALYAQARRLGGDQPVDLANARQALDEHISELSQTPGGAPGLAELQKLRAEMDAAFPVEGVKRMRSTLRDRFLSDGLRNSDLERRVGQVVDAADFDVGDALVAAGKGDAAQAYKAAAAAHKERVGIIDNILEPFIGKNGDKSVEDVMRSIDTATKTKGARLGKFLGSLPPDDAATVRATIISNLGRATPGAQDAAGELFSLPQFLTQWNRMSGKAKSELFGGEVRAALDDLAKVAEGTKEAQRFANFSNTGSVVGALATGAGATGFLSAPIPTALALAGQFGAGKLLASPRFARWLAKMPSQPAMIEKHVSALTKIAANDNAIAQDVIGLRQALEGVLERPMPSAAAPGPGAGTQSEQEPGERR